jgi:hypothetical protein
VAVLAAKKVSGVGFQVSGVGKLGSLTPRRGNDEKPRVFAKMLKTPPPIFERLSDKLGALG